MLRKAAGRVAREQIGAETWLDAAAPWWHHPGFGKRLRVMVVAMVASDCSIGIHTNFCWTPPSHSRAEKVLTAG